MTLRRTLPASFGLEQAKAHLEAVIEFNDFAFIDRLRGDGCPAMGSVPSGPSYPRAWRFLHLNSPRGR